MYAVCGSARTVDSGQCATLYIRNLHGVATQLFPTLRRCSPMRLSPMQEDDVRKYVIARKFEKNGKTVTKRPNIQRLITPIRIQRKRARAAARKTAQAKSQRDASEYARCVVLVCCVRSGRCFAVSCLRANILFFLCNTVVFIDFSCLQAKFFFFSSLSCYQ